MPDKKTLILLTDFFPFEAYEPYLENEFKYLSEAFEKIFIFSASEKQKAIYDLPANILYYNFPANIQMSSKVNALLSFDKGLFKTEKKFVNSGLQQKMDLIKIKIMIMEYFKAKMLKKYIKKTLHEELKNQGNILIYSYWCDYKAIAAALLKKEFPRMKAISRAHGWDVYFERNTAGYLPLRTFLFNTLDKVFFVSENGKAYTSAKFDDPSKFALAHLGTNQPAQPITEQKKEPFHIVSCSSLIPLKRIRLLIAAIALLPQDIEILWTHFGDGILMNEIVRLCQKKLSPMINVHVDLEGYVSNDEVLKFYAENNVNLLVNTSSTEGLPVTMMEAMSGAIPVIGTNVGGVGEIIKDNFNGFLLSANPEPKEITEKIVSFINMSGEKYSQFRRNAFETWNTKYNAAVNFPSFIEEIKQDI